MVYLTDEYLKTYQWIDRAVNAAVVISIVLVVVSVISFCAPQQDELPVPAFQEKCCNTH